MKFLLFLIIFPLIVQAQTNPSLPECFTKTLPDKSVTLDCILAELSLHETEKEINTNKIWLGIGSYVAYMRFYIKNPQLLSKLVIYKTVVGAIEECSVKNLFNLSRALLIMQSPSPNPGGNYLKGVFVECLKSLLSEELLNDVFRDMEFSLNKKSFSRRTQLN